MRYTRLDLLRFCSRRVINAHISVRKRRLLHAVSRPRPTRPRWVFII